jgi:putative heme-binding domain-containing protein
VARDPSDRSGALRLLEALLVPAIPGDLQRAAVDALAATADASVPAAFLDQWDSLPPGSRSAALESLLSREAWTLALLERIRDGTPVAVDASQRPRLLQHRSKRVRDLATTLLTAATPARTEVIRQFQPALRLAGDAARGRSVFTRVCVTCHKLGDLGNEVGPDLKSVAGHPPEKLLTNILDPSADVQPGYQAYSCELTDGTELHGLIAAETANSLTVKSGDGTKHVVVRREIAVLRGSNVSLMPEGLEAGCTAQDLADLIQFLRAGLAP